MKKLPILDHTNNERLCTYTVYKISDSNFEYVLKRHIIINEPFFDHAFEYKFNDLNTFHKEITNQGFVPFLPGPDDAPSIVMTYL